MGLASRPLGAHAALAQSQAPQREGLVTFGQTSVLPGGLPAYFCKAPRCLSWKGVHTASHSCPSLLDGDLVQGRRHQRSATGQSAMSTAAAFHTHAHAQQDAHHAAAVSHSAPDSPPWVLSFFYTCMKTFYYKEVSAMSPRQNLGQGHPIPSSTLVRWPGPARSSLGPQSWALAFRAALCFPVISLGNGTSPGQGTCPSTSQMHSRRQYFRGPKLAG